VKHLIVPPDADVFGIRNFIVVRTRQNEPASGREQFIRGGHDRFRVVQVFQDLAHRHHVEAALQFCQTRPGIQATVGDSQPGIALLIPGDHVF
jgi:hypothetical protein